MSDNETETPCVGICVVDIDSYLCIGCWRNMDEIQEWASMDEDEKQQVLRNIQLRKSQLN